MTMMRTHSHALKPSAIMAGLSLFEAVMPPTVSGVTYQDEFITERIEADVMRACEGGTWNNDYKRRVCHFGREYRQGKSGQAMPDVLLALGHKLKREGIFSDVPHSVHINEYLPGQGIGAHRDIDSDQIKTVAIVSLNSGAVMNFSRLGRDDVPFYLYRRSLLTIEGEALMKWMHAIPARKSDALGGLLVKRDRRLSAVFRGS